MMSNAARKKTAGEKSTPPAAQRAIEIELDAVLEWLKRSGTRETRDGMARYAIPSENAFGVTVGALRGKAKQLGPNHELAAALWATGWYEARLLAAFIDDPTRVTAAQMDRWCGDFDNWAVCDTVCFHLFDRTPHAWRKASQWTRRRGEFAKRGGFALMWSLSVHDKAASDGAFLAFLPLIEQGARDERNFVKKAVDMALRAIGKRNAALNTAAVTVAERLSASTDPTARWVGRSAFRELTSASVIGRIEARRSTRR